MSFLAELDRYLTVRRQLGPDLSTNERILRRFATFAEWIRSPDGQVVQPKRPMLHSVLSVWGL